MDCIEVKKLLESYIEDDVESETKKVIEAHLLSCNSCSEEYNELMKYSKAMGALRGHSAPGDFLEQVNRRIDGTSRAKKFIERLFLPLNIKIPLEAAGVLALVVIVFFIYSPEESLKRTLRPVADMEAPEPDYAIEDMAAEALSERGARLSTKPVPPVKTAEKKVSQAVPGRGAAAVIDKREKKPEPEEKGVIYEIALLKLPRAPEIATGGTAAEKEMESLSSGIKSSMPYSEEKPREEHLSDGFAEGAKMADAADDLKDEAAEADSAPAEARRDKSADIDTASRNTALPEIAGQMRPAPGMAEEIKSLTARLGGKVLKEEFSPDNKEIEYLIVEISSSDYAVFMNEINKIGTLRKMGPPEAQKNMDTQKIRIQIIDQ